MTDAALQATPFHEAIALLNHSMQWERWLGYATVSHFYNPGMEYAAIRNAASLYDISPMRKYDVSGPDAVRFLNRLITRDIERCKPGRCFYTPWCNGEGKVIEEGTIFRFTEDRFRINCGEHNLTWFRATADGLDVNVDEVSDDIAALSLQGPEARTVLERVGLTEAAGLRWFGLVETELDDAPMMVSRTGFTGDLGYELWTPREHALALWERLMAAGQERDVTPIGSAALNIARVEAGHIQVHSEYLDARVCVDPGEKRSPRELGLDWAVDLRKPHFNGRRALAMEQEHGGPPLRLVGLEVAGRRPAVDSMLYAGKRIVGQTTAAVWSPLLKRSIALALVQRRYATPGTVLGAEVDFRRELRLQRSDQIARVVAPKFIDLERRRA